MGGKGPGRPVRSAVRENLVELLFFLGKSHGYQLYSLYCRVFPRVTRRAVYYQLKRGLELGFFRVSEVEIRPGNYSWGQTAERVVYALTDKVRPVGDARVKKQLNTLKS
ncbi:hypothetical protein COT48_02785 [Candidatus Woesearchaeota archaeon CG08_land_8_20_14_0_20_47_9]|nr:MAG: hypothetical protein COT48_02785 [Candidatus Woesearchaeota archaeon CG08_land_8_20_14_0_20_47_9]HII29680.1 hypothetical protein [Candidatus Woesearchaeota archaeon]